LEVLEEELVLVVVFPSLFLAVVVVVAAVSLP
jgi:hypothetical protein